MKKFIFALALFTLVSCDPTPKPGKCSDPAELKDAILNHSTDTARYDLNGDKEITVADLDYLITHSQTDSVASKDTI